ncbi:MAG: BtaA family protein [Pseudomonadota bacterium]
MAHPGKAKSTGNYIFTKVHSSQLIYNTCWEDPRIDRELLQLEPGSRAMMITSAGCNAIEYLLDDPDEVVCVDLNHRQNALLELKRAVILHLEYDDLFQWFGKGFHPRAGELYRGFRSSMPEYAQHYWDKRIDQLFDRALRRSFYYRGSSGLAAWLLKNLFFRLKPRVRHEVYELLETENLAEQRALYFRIEERLWNRVIEALLRSPMIMNMVGVPRAQLDLINRDTPGGLVSFVRGCLRNVFTQISLSDNYFWRVYLRGEYTPTCCPEYLKEENHELIRNRLERLSAHTTSFSDYLKERPESFSHFVLLDHQDWLAWYRPELLEEEWREIRAHAQPGTRVLMRSAGLEVDFCAPNVDGWLSWRNDRARELHASDRVGTYASCHLGVVHA